MVYAFTIDQSTFAPAKFSNIGTLLNLVLPLVLTGAGFIFLAMTLMAGLNIMTHGDNPDALKKAYASMTYAVVGLLIIIASFVIVRVIGVMIGAGTLIP